MGMLNYSVSLGNTPQPCPYDTLSNMSPDLGPVPGALAGNGVSGNFADTAPDAATNPANTLSITVNVARCCPRRARTSNLASRGDELLTLWREFEEAESRDARFTRAVDRVQPVLVPAAGDGSAWASRPVTLEEEQAIATDVRQLWPPLGDIVDAILVDALARGYLRSSGASAGRSASDT
jgi:HD domain